MAGELIKHKNFFNSFYSKLRAKYIKDVTKGGSKFSTIVSFKSDVTKKEAFPISVEVELESNKLVMLEVGHTVVIGVPISCFAVRDCRVKFPDKARENYPDYDFDQEILKKGSKIDFRPIGLVRDLLGESKVVPLILWDFNDDICIEFNEEGNRSTEDFPLDNPEKYFILSNTSYLYLSLMSVTEIRFGDEWKRIM